MHIHIVIAVDTRRLALRIVLMLRRVPSFASCPSLSFVSLHVQRAADMAIVSNDLIAKAEDVADQVCFLVYSPDIPHFLVPFHRVIYWEDYPLQPKLWLETHLCYLTAVSHLK